MSRKLFKIGVGILLLFLIIYVGSLIKWIFYPFGVIFQTLFLPITLAGFFYYLLRPIVKQINRKSPVSLSILLIYFALLCIGIGILLIIVPILQEQFNSLLNNLPFIISEIQGKLVNIQESSIFQIDQLEDILNLEEFIFQLGDIINQSGRKLATNISNFIGVLANAVLGLIITPFILFYLLRDGEKLGDSVVNIFKDKHKNIGLVFNDIDRTLSSYIQGQGIVCLCVGSLCYIAYLIIGLDYALLLAVIAGLTNIIPYFGPWIGTIPAVVVGFFQSTGTSIIVIILVVIIQQIESNLITPQVIGKKLKMHPIIIMFLILIAGRLVGLIGMILVIPTYAVARVIITHLIKNWSSQLNK